MPVSEGNVIGAIRKPLLIAFGALAIIFVIIVNAIDFVRSSPTELAKQPEARPAMVGFALATRKYHLEGTDKGEHPGFEDSASQARWLPLRDVSLWYQTESEKASLEGNAETFFHAMGLVGMRQDDSYYLLVNTSSDASMWTYDQNWTVETAFHTIDSVGRPAIIIRLDEQGANLLDKLSSSHVGDSLAIIINNQVFCAPVISGPISKNVIVEGNFTFEEIERLVRALTGEGR